MAENKHCNIHGEAGRSVVKALVCRLNAPFEHGGAAGKLIVLVVNQVFASDYYCHACGGDVFLRARVNHRVVGHVYHSAENFAGHIRDYGHVGFGQKVVARAENGIVRAHMEILRVGAYIELAGNIGEVFVLAACRDVYVAEAGGLFVGFGGEIARQHIIGFVVFAEQVQRNCGKLLACAALNEQNVIIVGHVEQFSQAGLDFVVDCFKSLGAVAHFRYAHAGVCIVEHIALDFLQHFERKSGGAC